MGFFLKENMHQIDINDTDLNKTASAVYEMAFNYGQTHIAPLNALLDETNAFPAPLWQSMGEQGLLGISQPELYGGSGASFMAQIAATAAISYHSGSIGLSQLAHVDLCMGRLKKHGSEEQKQRFLPGLIKGTLVGALAMSEPGAGSDVMAMQTRAEKVEGGYNIVQGEKTWITNGGTADVLVVYAKTADKKLTAFLVEKDMPGFTPGNKINKIGMRGSETYQLHFDNCFVPEKNILGQVDAGAHILMDGLNTERVTLSAAALGLAENSLDVAALYTGQRHQFGKSLMENQSVAFDLADMDSKLRILRSFVYSTARMYDMNKEFLTNAQAASVFLEAGRIGTEVTDQCIKLCGGMGYTKDMRLGQNRDDMMLYQIGGGTEKVRQMVIAREFVKKISTALELTA